MAGSRVLSHGLHAEVKNGSAASELRAPMRITCIMVQAFTADRIQGRGAIYPALLLRAPLDNVIQDHRQSADMLTTETVPGKHINTARSERQSIKPSPDRASLPPCSGLSRCGLETPSKCHGQRAGRP